MAEELATVGCGGVNAAYFASWACRTRGTQTELDPLLRRVARKRLIRTAAMRRRDRLILAVLGHHTRRDLLTGVHTDIDWVLALAPHLAPPDAASA